MSEPELKTWISWKASGQSIVILDGTTQPSSPEAAMDEDEGERGQLLWRPVHPESPSVPSQGSPPPGSSPTIIPLRDCGLEIKERRAASYDHLTQSLITLPIFSPSPSLPWGQEVGHSFFLSEVTAGGLRAGKQDFSLIWLSRRKFGVWVGQP